MDGTIDVQSAPGQGSTFTVSLVLPCALEKDTSPSSDVQPAALYRKK